MEVISDFNISFYREDDQFSVNTMLLTSCWSSDTESVYYLMENYKIPQKILALAFIISMRNNNPAINMKLLNNIISDKETIQDLFRSSCINESLSSLGCMFCNKMFDVEDTEPVYIAIDNDNVDILRTLFENGFLITRSHLKYSIETGNYDCFLFLFSKFRLDRETIYNWNDFMNKNFETKLLKILKIINIGEANRDRLQEFLKGRNYLKIRSYILEIKGNKFRSMI